MSTDKADRIAALLIELASLMAEQPAPAPTVQRTMPEGTMLTVEEAAESLRIGRTRMFALIKSGAVESVMIGRLRRIPTEAIKKYTARLSNRQSYAA
jgi:excisionase family DNA binding protein